MPSYQYKELRRDTQEFRLINLLPGEFGDQLCFNIFHKPLTTPLKALTKPKRWPLDELQKTLCEGWSIHETLDSRYLFVRWDTDGMISSWSHPEADFDRGRYELQEDPEPVSGPEYEALSYTWGAVKDSFTAHIVDSHASGQNISTFQIGSNLNCALRHLRYADKPRTMWVDAICINQKNHEERDAQVKRMKHVYSLASRVVVWLGAEANESNISLSTIQYLSDQAEYTMDYRVCASPRAKEPRWFSRVCPLPYDKKTWSAIISLFGRSWFSRLWVLQEVQFANHRSVVQCGNDILPWSSLRKAILVLGGKHNLPQELKHQIDLNRYAAWPMSTLNLRRLLISIRARQCSDARDKVFGILSLAPPWFADSIQPQYRLSVNKIYQSAFLAHVDRVQRLELLADCWLAKRRKCGASWTPNWAKPLPFQILGNGYAAGLSAAQTRNFNADILEVSGKQCGVVRTVGEVASGTSSEILRTIRDWEPEDILSSSYKTGGTLFDAFLSLLCAGSVKERFPDNHRYPSLEDVRQEYLAKVSGTSSLETAQDLTCLRLDHCAHRAFITTHDGYIGLVPAGARPGALSIISS